ncbi:MAG: rod shape-determining protein MreD [Bacteroidia bacterium]|jgi:rod shape-determining protein MreD|nr:rod shape-determining protein MreD [Bacteroidota bacterium]MBP6512216.1 rod shape-determining protein MreD [Bacteroidia bacterium]MBP7245121.1 rod shape-determining protein MreD [Bacteroidia bacterium]
MILVILRHLFRFLLLMSMQIFILNNIQLGTFINPFLYILFLLSLPVNLPKLLLLPIAFLTGLSIDMFQNTPGMHASACLFMVYLRPYWLKIISPRDGYDIETEPSIKKLGFAWYMAYASLLVFVHHLFLFFIEVFRFSEFFDTLIRIALSSLLTLLLIIIAQYLTSKPKSTN